MYMQANVSLQTTRRDSNPQKLHFKYIVTFLSFIESFHLACFDYYYVLIDWVGGPDGKIWSYDHRAFPFFLIIIIFFSGNKIRNVHLRRSFWPKSRDLYSNKVVLVRISRAHSLETIDKISVWGPYAILAGPDGFFRACSRYRVRPSYGDFLNSFAMKARAGPYGSYDKYGLLTKLVLSRWLDIGQVLFFACLWTSTSKHAKKRTRPISSHLDRTSLANKGFIIWLKTPKNDLWQEVIKRSLYLLYLASESTLSRVDLFINTSLGRFSTLIVEKANQSRAISASRELWYFSREKPVP